jgi:hypothetical protein
MPNLSKLSLQLEKLLDCFSPRLRDTRVTMKKSTKRLILSLRDNRKRYNFQNIPRISTATIYRNVRSGGYPRSFTRVLIKQSLIFPPCDYAFRD